MDENERDKRDNIKSEFLELRQSRHPRERQQLIESWSPFFDQSARSAENLALVASLRILDTFPVAKKIE